MACGPDIPDPPDPYETAGAQTGSNVGTAVANAWLNNTSQYGPGGSRVRTQTGTYQWTDPNTGKVYDIPQFSETTSLTPTGQQAFDTQQASQLALAQMANSQIGRVSDVLSTPMSLNGAPKAGTAGNYQQFGPGPKLATTFDDAGAITKTYGTDFSEDRQRVEDALMARMQPGLDKNFSRLETRLANQGIAYGSDAFSGAMGDLGRQENDARMAAIINAGGEQSRLVNLEANRAAFQNAAQQQQYGQNLGRATFANQGEQQMYGNAFNANQANNALAGRTFEEQNALRNQYLQEQYALRNQTINETGALMSGGQVTMPQFGNTQIGSIPTTDIAGAINTNYGQRVNQAQAQYQSGADMFGGVLGAGSSLGSAWLMSDRRSKKDIHNVGKTDDGQKLYSYRYKGEGPEVPVRIGLMAQEVEKKHPHAVMTGADGFKRVNYNAALRV